jgi:hypothetical protein
MKRDLVLYVFLFVQIKEINPPATYKTATYMHDAEHIFIYLTTCFDKKSQFIYS